MTDARHHTPIDENARPRAVLAAVQLPGVSEDDHAASLAELGRLVHTLGYVVIGTVSQKRSSPANDAVLGEGKLKELARFTGGPGKVTKNIPRKKSKLASDDEDDTPHKSAGELARDAMREAREEAFQPLPEDQRAQFVIVDNEVSPSQLKNLESACDAEVMDRAGVIVEIFHRHARTREAKLQVEIARLKYLAPRLRMTRQASERSGAGIGAKGVGETAHELDKRRIRDRIAELARELEEIHAGATERRARRSEALKVALVGYTNAGKSSLMRALTGSDVLVEDKLFATLDTTVRVLQPEGVPRILVSDTVGFIKKLPHDLVASFRSTLDEAHDASLLLFVADASDKTFRSQLAVTREVIGEIGAADITARLLLNKVDQLTPPEIAALRLEFPDAVLLSTRVPEDIQKLKAMIKGHFESAMTEVELRIPYDKTHLIGEIRRSVQVVSEDADETGMMLKVRGSAENVAKLQAKL